MHSNVEAKGSKNAPHHTASTCINGPIVLDCYINSLSSPTNNCCVGRSRIHIWRSVGEATLSESPSEIPMGQCQYIMRLPMVYDSIGASSWLYRRLLDSPPQHRQRTESDRAHVRKPGWQAVAECKVELSSCHPCQERRFKDEKRAMLISSTITRVSPPPFARLHTSSDVQF